MSTKRLSSKKKKFPKDNAQTEVLHRLGLEAYWTSPLDPASMLNIHTWTLESEAAVDPKDLLKSFLQRLWLLRQDARSTCCQTTQNAVDSDNRSPEELCNGLQEEVPAVINPLDLVTAAYMSADTFLQQEMTVRMIQCQFAVPLVLPNIEQEEPSQVLLWPLRAVMTQWRSHFPDNSERVQDGDLASTGMPMVSCVKLGRCGMSKSQVLNHILSGVSITSETFLHKGMDGGKLPRRFSNGLVEIGLFQPTGDTTRDHFPIPLVIANLRGDASVHEKCLSLLCKASSAVVVFCGDLRKKDRELLVSCRNMASKLILIDLSEIENNANRVVGFVDQNLEDHMGLPQGSVLQGRSLDQEDLANKLCNTLKDLLPDELKLVTLEATANTAEEMGLNVDEGPVCKMAMATVEKVLEGLEDGSAEFKLKQLPLQGPLWSRLSELEKEESKQRNQGKEIDPQLKEEKKNILVELSSYKMTPAMKIFTDTLFTADKVERAYFLSWLKLRLQQTKKQNNPQDAFRNLHIEKRDATPEQADELENEASGNMDDSDSFCTDSTFEEETDVLPESGEFQISEGECEEGDKFQDILQSTEKSKETESEEKEHPESIHDQILLEEIETASNEKDVEDEKIIENSVCLDEQISHSDSENQMCHLESVKNGSVIGHEKQEDNTEVIDTMPDSDSSVEHLMPLSNEHQVSSNPHHFEPDPSSLGLEHFLREMGLIFELTHISPGSGSHNVLRLPSLATDLLLYGIPIELMDGDASNIPIHWLSCVFAELKRCLPQEQCRTRVLTNLGVHQARNAEAFSALFGVKFPEGRNRSSRGVYMVALCLPDGLREDMGCDFLLLIDVEGLCSVSLDDRDMLVQDSEMATVATGLSDVLLLNTTSHGGYELETNIAVLVSALLRAKEMGSMPNCQFLVQDVGINSILQASQLRRVSEMLETDVKENGALTKKDTICVNGPWSKASLSEPVDSDYSETVLKLKKSLFDALKNCAAKSTVSSLPEFLRRLFVAWDRVKTEAFPISLHNTDIALAFSLFCTKLSKWNSSFLETMENWLMGATTRIFATKVKALDATAQNNLLRELKGEATEKVQTEVDDVTSKAESYLMETEPLTTNAEMFRPILMSNMSALQERVTEEIMEKLEIISESHCSSTQLNNFQILLENEQESVLHALIEKSKSTQIVLQDTDLEEEFEGVWNKALSIFDFRPSDTDNITARVTRILRENLISRGLLKHIKKLEIIGQSETNGFQVYDEHFGYRSRLKHMFDDNNRPQRLKAQKLAGNIIEDYKQFVEDKCSMLADFSDSYITELLEKVEKALKENSMEIKSAFEVDLKVYLCNAASHDFQDLHDRFAKDRDLLKGISATKSMHSAEFIYHFRKRDQCHRLAQAFTSMVFKPTVLDYINRSLGANILEEIIGKGQEYQSPKTFHQYLLEQLITEDSFESYQEYLISYDNFRLEKIQGTVKAHLSESTNIGKWRQQKLGEIVGKISSAVSQTTEGTDRVLSNAKPLLEIVCLTLERDEDVIVHKEPLNGPLFSFTTEWDSFVKCLMEFLATMRLNLAQEFSQKIDVKQLLNSLPVQPQECLFNKIRGCEKRCPFCRAPCDEEAGHEVHKAFLHWPKGMSPYDSSSLSSVSANKDEQDKSMTCKDLDCLFGWSASPSDPNAQTISDYWRYVLARYNEKFAEKFEQEPATIPEEWKRITQEEALDCLK